MSKIAGKGTPKKGKFSKAEKIKVLLLFEQNNFSLSQTVRETGISISSLQRWDKSIGPEVYKTKPSPNIAIRLVNQLALREVTQEQIKLLRANVTINALQELNQRAQGAGYESCLEKTDDLIKMSNLFKEELTKDTGGSETLAQSRQNVSDLMKQWEENKNKTIILNADDAQVVG